MTETQSLSHSAWECKYHIVWITKYRKKTIYAELRRYLARQKECAILEGHLMSDHVHMLIS
ncbi:transposase, partial [Desulforegula conservatrix]